MTTRPRYQRSAIVGSREVLRDSRGRVIDDVYVERAAEDALRQVRGRGRPSLSSAGESPVLRVRVSRDLDAAVRQAAQRSGESVAQWVRHTLERASRRAAG
jgi:predicted HicB family RNase H-like nuclease